MGVDRQYYTNSFTFDSETWDGDDGGPMEVIDSENPEVISDPVANDIMPTFVKPVGYKPSVLIKIRDREHLPTRGAISELVCHSTTTAGNRTRTYHTMVYINHDTSDIRAQPGETVLRFDHQAADGTVVDWFTDAAE